MFKLLVKYNNILIIGAAFAICSNQDILDEFLQGDPERKRKIASRNTPVSFSFSYRRNDPYVIREVISECDRFIANPELLSHYTHYKSDWFYNPNPQEETLNYSILFETF